MVHFRCAESVERSSFRRQALFLFVFNPESFFQVFFFLLSLTSHTGPLSVHGRYHWTKAIPHFASVLIVQERVGTCGTRRTCIWCCLSRVPLASLGSWCPRGYLCSCYTCVHRSDVGVREVPRVCVSVSTCVCMCVCVCEGEREDGWDSMDVHVFQFVRPCV